MSNIELKSFLTKFHQLKNAGFTAHLDLHAHHGQCWVGLRAQLGQAGQQPPRHHPQQRPRLRRSPAYARRQERRQAARQQAAAAVPASEVPAAEARANEENEGDTVTEEEAAETPENVVSTEEVENPSKSPPPLIDNPDARIMPNGDWPGPKWWCDVLGTFKEIHGNTKLILSKELQTSLYWPDQVMTHSLFIRKLWTSMKMLPLNYECFDPAGSAMTTVFGTDVVKWTSLRDYLAPHLYLHSSRIGVFN